jgi:glycosyltransferase involved in cell wall biosynthesis
MIFIIIGKWFSIPIVNHIHGAEFDEFYTNATERKKRLIARIYLKCDVIIVLSREWKDKLKPEINGLDVRIVENFSTIPNKVTVPDNRENIILFLGYIGNRKGAYDVPSVVKKVIAHIPDVKFILCGNGEVEELRKVIKENNLENYMELTGWISGKQKDELLNRCKIYFLPTYNEGLPMSVLEGMAYGLPIVSTNVGGIPTVISTGINGYLFEPGSILDFANAILKLLNDQNLRKRMYRNNIDKISKKYSLESNVRKISAIYNQIEKRKGNGENQHRRFVNRQSRYSGGMQDNS